MENLINQIKESTDTIFYIKFDSKIVYGNKHSVLYFLIHNLFNCDACLLITEGFKESKLKKVFIDIKPTPDVAKAAQSNNVNTQDEYDIPITELIKAVNNLKEITLNQQTFLTTI
jgi:molybdopterin-guanine dinucleotide biosynthesis protein